MYNNNNNNVTPGVAFANGMQQTAMLGIAQNQAQSNYNQGYNQGVKEAWEIANKQIAELKVELDQNEAKIKQLRFMSSEKGDLITQLKGVDWYNQWNKQAGAKGVTIYNNVLIKKGYTLKK